MKRTIRHCTLAWVIVAALANGHSIGASDAEDVLKSAAVLGFLRYSEWPSATAGGAITVGVLGRSSFVQVLREYLDGKLVQNRPVRVVDFKDDPRCCQLIYFATDHAPEIKQTLQAVPHHVLTVGETGRFLDYGGAVNLFLEDGHIAFEASLSALNRAGVAISASLLRLGQIRDREKARAAR